MTPQNASDFVLTALPQSVSSVLKGCFFIPSQKLKTCLELICYNEFKIRKGVCTMFWRILKKDLKRKKTMNVIMLLFIILSSMFAAAAVNNVVAVNGGIDSYFELAGVPDAVVSMHTDCDADKKIE